MSTEETRCTLYDDGRRQRDLAIGEISSVSARDGQFAWISVPHPKPETLRALQEAFGLHDLAVEDALRAHQRPKAEEYGDSLFVVVRTVRWDEEKKCVAFGETHLFVADHYLVAVRHGASTPHTEVRERCEATPHLLRKGPAYALYAVLDFVIDSYFPVLDELEAEVEDLEDDLFSSRPGSQLTQRAYRLRRELGRFKRVVTPLLEVLHRLMRVDLRLVPEDIRVYFRDVYDHVMRINESLEQLRETAHSAIEANLALVSVRQNETMQMLAAYAAILAIPTLAAGIFGMNFDPMPGLHADKGFLVALGGMGVACTLLFWRFRRIGWL
jgi:magnesium transporter